MDSRHVAHCCSRHILQNDNNKGCGVAFINVKCGCAECRAKCTERKGGKGARGHDEHIEYGKRRKWGLEKYLSG